MKRKTISYVIETKWPHESSWNRLHTFPEEFGENNAFTVVRGYRTVSKAESSTVMHRLRKITESVEDIELDGKGRRI